MDDMICTWCDHGNDPVLGDVVIMDDDTMNTHMGFRDGDNTTRVPLPMPMHAPCRVMHTKFPNTRLWELLENAG